MSLIWAQNKMKPVSLIILARLGGMRVGALVAPLPRRRATVTSGESVSGGAHSQTVPPPSGSPELKISEADGLPAGELKGPGTGAN